MIANNFLYAVAMIADGLLTAYFWIVIISALLSWVRPDPYNPIVRFLYAATEPVYRRLRRLFPFLMVGGFDLSPIVVIIAIQFIQNFLVRTLVQMSVRGVF